MAKEEKERKSRYVKEVEISIKISYSVWNALLCELPFLICLMLSDLFQKYLKWTTKIFFARWSITIIHFQSFNLQIFDHHHLKFILLCTTFSILLFMAFDRDLLCELICRLIAGYEKWLMLRIRDLFRILNSTAESIELHHHLFTTF